MGDIAKINQLAREEGLTYGLKVADIESQKVEQKPKPKNWHYLKAKAKKNIPPKKSNKIYMRVTPDKYEFPVEMADTAKELAKLCGVSQVTVLACLSRRFNSVYKCVEV